MKKLVQTPSLYGKGELSSEICNKIIQEGHAQGMIKGTIDAEGAGK